MSLSVSDLGAAGTATCDQSGRGTQQLRSPTPTCADRTDLNRARSMLGRGPHRGVVGWSASMSWAATRAKAMLLSWDSLLNNSKASTASMLYRSIITPLA